MKKFTNNTTLVSLVLGILLLLASLSFFDSGVDALIVIGVFQIIVGIAYILSGVLDLLAVDSTPVGLTKGIISIAAFPLYIFVYYLVAVIVGGDGLGVAGWILSILVLIAALSTIALGVASYFVNNEMIVKLARFAILLLLCLLIVIIIFPITGGTAALGDISIFEVACIICYFLITKSFTQLKKEE